MAKVTVTQGDTSAISVNSRVVDPTKISISATPSSIQVRSGSNISDKHFTHDQSNASATWVITHNLGKYASVTVVDSANTVVICDVVYDSTNQVTLSFDSATAGKAYLN